MDTFTITAEHFETLYRSFFFMSSQYLWYFDGFLAPLLKQTVPFLYTDRLGTGYIFFSPS